MVSVVFAWMEAASAREHATTHPMSRERFQNAIESNSEAAKEVFNATGLSRDDLTSLLPQKGA
jgi:3-oxoacyl-[acyl-carrier-protein] synthase III